MTKKQTLVSLLFVFMAITSFGLVWNWFLKFNECNLRSETTQRLMDNQEDILFTFRIIKDRTLKEDSQKTFEKYINLKEIMIKGYIEHFAESCQSRLNRNRLITILKSFELYLVAKQSLFKENQNFNWLRGLIPFEPVYENYEI